MIYYIIIIILFVFAFLFELKKSKAANYVFSILAFAILCSIGGLRFQVGQDWESYTSFFNNIESIKNTPNDKFEVGFTVLTYLLKKISDNTQFFIFVIFLTAFSIKFWIYKKFSTNIFISLIIYVYTIFVIYDLNGMRQGVAIGLTLASLPCIIRKKLIPFLIIVFLASFFHKSALVFIPFYWLSRIKLSNKMLVFFLFIVLLIAVPLRDFFSTSDFFFNLMDTEDFGKYYTYVTDDVNFVLNVEIISFTVFQRLIIFIGFLFYFHKININENLKLLLRNGYLIGIILFLLFSFSSEMAARISYYYKGLEAIFIPFIISAPQKMLSRLLLLLFFTVFAMIGLQRILEIPNGGLLPYKSILFNF